MYLCNVRVCHCRPFTGCRCSIPLPTTCLRARRGSNCSPRVSCAPLPTHYPSIPYLVFLDLNIPVFRVAVFVLRHSNQYQNVAYKLKLFWGFLSFPFLSTTLHLQITLQVPQPRIQQRTRTNSESDKKTDVLVLYFSLVDFGSPLRPRPSPIHTHTHSLQSNPTCPATLASPLSPT